MVKRPGFGLVEVVVAITLLGIGVMSVGASAAFASRILRMAENQEAAARLAGALVDSLAMAASAVAGESGADRFRAVWRTGSDGELTVVVVMRDPPHDTVASAAITLAVPLPRLPCEPAPCD